MNLSATKLSLKNVLLFILWGYFTFLMLKITLAYIPVSSKVAFLAIKQEEVNHIPGYLPIFYTHVYTSIFVLVLGFFQLFQFPKIIHRTAGYAYVILILLFAAPSGIFIGYYANGGIWAQIAFVLLGILWIFYTSRSIIRIKNKDYKGHQFDMWRSYALSLSALTLRAWKVGIVYFFQPNPLDAYIIVAWLGWIINWLIIEYYINLKKSKR